MIIEAIKIFTILVILYIAYLFRRIKLWASLPKETKIIMFGMILYVIINQIIDIIIKDINARLNVVMIITIIYIILVVFMFTRFLNRVKGEIYENRENRKEKEIIEKGSDKYDT